MYCVCMQMEKEAAFFLSKAFNARERQEKLAMEVMGATKSTDILHAKLMQV